MATETIKLFGGSPLGTITTDSSGNKTAKSFGGRTIATYEKSSNTTKLFGGVPICTGDACAGCLLCLNDNIVNKIKKYK